VSKIFEALRKTESAAAEAAMSVLGEQAAVASRAPVAEQPRKVEHALLETPTIELRAEAIRIAPNSPMLPFDGSDARAAEQYRIIRTKIRHHPEQPRMILISSPMPGDGKTVSAANLAGVLALQENLRVLLVDCDFRRSSLTRLLGLEVTGAPGLGEVLRGEATLESALVSIGQFPNLYVLPPGDPSPNPSELLSTAKWAALTELFRREFRFTIFDAPPVGAVADYELLQMACDSVVLIARPDHTNRQLWRKALEAVPKSKQLGVILNCVEDWFLWKTHGYYYYSQNSR
jgi:capsular exopolysaccharide synthesis family protein